MRKIIILLFAIVFVTGANCQTLDLEQIQDPQMQQEATEWYNRKFIDGYTLGALWKARKPVSPVLHIIREETDKDDRYFLRIDLYSPSGAYAISIKEYPRALLTDENGGTITLVCDSLTPVVSTCQNNSWPAMSFTNDLAYVSAAVPRASTTQTRIPTNRKVYCTCILYSIPDIQDFLTHSFVDFNFCDGRIRYNISDAGKKQTDQFCKQMQKAKKHFETTK